MTQKVSVPFDACLTGGGEMGALMRAFDWSVTPIGAVSGWPQSLKTAVSICLNSHFPIVLWWGPDLLLLYNDAWRSILGRTKHPQALGSLARETWPEIWDTIGPMVERVVAAGEAAWLDDRLLMLDRNGYSQEAYFSYSYSPIRDESGNVGGVFATVQETTQRVIGERRLRALSELDALAEANSAEQACSLVAEVLAHNLADLPFALFYLLNADGTVLTLNATTSLQNGTPASPRVVALTGPQVESSGWPLAEVSKSGKPTVVHDLPTRFGPLAGGSWEGSPHTAIVLPVMAAGHESPAGLLVAGVSSALVLDAAYESFLQLVAGHAGTAVTKARAHEAARKRAEAIAEMTRAKDVFLASVRQKSQTPPTEILGPREAARRFLIEASEVLASSLDYEQTLQRVANLAIPRIADWCHVDMLDDDGAIRLLAVAHVEPEKADLVYEFRQHYPLGPDEAQGISAVLRTGKPEVYPDIPDQAIVAGARDPRHLEMIRQIGIRSVMIVPIIARGRILGAMTFTVSEASGRRFTREDLTLAEGLAARAALAIDNARLYRAAQAELSERRRAQDALRRSEERFRFALANSDISVYMEDRDLRYTWIYSGKLRGERTGIYGKTDEEFMEAEDAARLSRIKRRVLRTGVEERHTVRVTYLGEEPGFYDTLFAPLRDSEGEIVGITGTVNDITERKKTQDALAQHQAEIEALNVRLQRAMRETHHRVKNNLQIVAALIDMQEMEHKGTVPTKELRRLTQHINALAVMHDLLTHQARTDPEVTDISVHAMMDKLMPAILAMAGGRGIDVQVEDLQVPVSHGSTLAVLVNELISNSLKHGDGEIAVRCYVEGDQTRLEVLDRGPGFPENFDPDTAANTGMDLIQSLSRWDLNGSVRFQNRQGGGARVVIEFPIPGLETTLAQP